MFHYVPPKRHGYGVPSFRVVLIYGEPGDVIDFPDIFQTFTRHRSAYHLSMALWFTILRQDFATIPGEIRLLVEVGLTNHLWSEKSMYKLGIACCCWFSWIIPVGHLPNVLHISPNEAWWNSRNCCCWTPHFCCQNTQVRYREITINPHVCCLNSHLGLHLHVIHILLGDIGNYRYIYGDGSFFFRFRAPQMSIFSIYSSIFVGGTQTHIDHDTLW